MPLVFISLYGLFLTWVRRHVLSNVSRVAARDSARTLATIQDLFTALGEDDALYGTLKSMKGASRGGRMW